MKTLALALALVLAMVAPFGLAAQSASSAPTVPLTEGPFYKPGSPESADLAGAGIPGKRITITGTVSDLRGTPIAGAWLDFWQADGAGRYDNEGFRLRGHQPGSRGNSSDPIFDKSLVVAMSPDGASARIDFVIPAR